jgi:hypothetical protein
VKVQHRLVRTLRIRICTFIYLHNMYVCIYLDTHLDTHYYYYILIICICVSIINPQVQTDRVCPSLHHTSAVIGAQHPMVRTLTIRICTFI